MKGRSYKISFSCEEGMTLPMERSLLALEAACRFYEKIPPELQRMVEVVKVELGRWTPDGARLELGAVLAWPDGEKTEAQVRHFEGRTHIVTSTQRLGAHDSVGGRITLLEDKSYAEQIAAGLLVITRIAVNREVLRRDKTIQELQAIYDEIQAATPELDARK